jgi:glycosyltransferase involved in cell wall biosynthesis
VPVSRLPQHHRSDRSSSASKPALLCLAPSFAPDTTPTAIRASKLLHRCSERWEVTVLTEGSEPRSDRQIRVETVRSRRPARLLAALRRLRLAKLLELLLWPDESIFWVLPAVLRARRLLRELEPAAIVVFMMPYSAGLAGIALSRLSGLPLILNLDDSPTCTDMHPHFPTRLHDRLARALEDLYVRRADAVVYVSATNLASVRSRQRADDRDKLQLVRYGADARDATDVEDAAAAPAGRSADAFEIAYVGAMSGWWSLLEPEHAAGLAERLFERWTRLGRYERTVLDQRTSSPAIVGEAILDAISAHPGWEGRLGLTIVGNPYPQELVTRALAACGIERVVTVLDPVPHEQIDRILARADLLFLTLPRRVDGSRGGRISAKTYEYLTTDRPILAAVPQGENRDYLAGRPGVWVVEPDERGRMAQVIAELAEAKFAGEPQTFDRADLRAELSYAARAGELEAVIEMADERRQRATAGFTA